MKTLLFDVQFLTPALLSGAYAKGDSDYPATAELRAPSIRGQLRWWFRFLGKSREVEERVFGSAADEHTSASGFILRVVNPPAPVSKPQTARQLGLHDGPVVDYLAFNLRNHQDARSVLAPGTPFQVLMINKRLNDKDWREIQDLAHIFFQMGSLGTRSRRGFGALTLCHTEVNDKRLLEIGQILPASVEFRAVRLPGQPAYDWLNFLKKTGAWLREKRGTTPRHTRNQLWGTAGQNGRVASAMLLRPIPSEEGWLLGVIGRSHDMQQASI